MFQMCQAIRIKAQGSSTMPASGPKYFKRFMFTYSAAGKLFGLTM